MVTQTQTVSVHQSKSVVRCRMLGTSGWVHLALWIRVATAFSGVKAELENKAGMSSLVHGLVQQWLDVS